MPFDRVRLAVNFTRSLDEVIHSNVCRYWVFIFQIFLRSCQDSRATVLTDPINPAILYARQMHDNNVSI